MKLISLNTWGCRVTEPIFEFIKKQSEFTDIFCFQEISKDGNGRTEKDELKDAYERISAALPDYTGYFCGYGEEGHYYEKRKDEIDFQFGIASFVRSSLKQNFVEEITFHEPQKKWSDYNGRFAAGAALAITIEDYAIINVHGLWQGGIKADTEAKLEQSRKIIDLADKVNGKKVICGDFNLLPDIKSTQIFRDKYTDLIQKYDIKDTRGKLYTKDLRHADYAFVDKDIKVNDFSVSKLEISDHLPLILEFS